MNVQKVSYGEGAIRGNQRGCGTVQVRNLVAHGQYVPTLEVWLGMSLEDLGVDPMSGVNYTKYEFKSLRGELRLTEYAETVAKLDWNDQRGRVYSYNPLAEHQAVLTGSIEPWKLETLERWRNGKSPELWLALFGTMFGKPQGWFETEIDVVRLKIDREKWLEVLAGLGHGKRALIEVPLPDLSGVKLGDALHFVEEAKTAFNEGRYKECVGRAREVLNQIVQTVKDDVDPDLNTYLTQTAPERAQIYAAIFTKTRKLGNKGSHGVSPFGRAEAQFILQTAIHLLALFGELTAKSGEPNPPTS